MSYIVEKLMNLSLAGIWSYLSKPSLVLARLQAPTPSSLTETVLSIFKDSNPEEIERYRLEFLRNHRFFEQMDEKMVAKRFRRVTPADWLQLVYVLVRMKRPDIIVETGVFDGESSATYLQALHDNQKGFLISIDLPAVDILGGSAQSVSEAKMPAGCQPGWVIPDNLRDRHELLLGDSKKLLPGVFDKHPQIDIFMHDSLHTYEHQLFEYRTAWVHLAPGGLLLSDDIFWNAAFHKFCEEMGQAYCYFSGTTRLGGPGAEQFGVVQRAAGEARKDSSSVAA